MLPPMGDDGAATIASYLGRTIQALADGRAAYVRALGESRPDAIRRPRRRSDQRADGAARPAKARSRSWCAHRYELRLHKARGYGALKAILEILAEEEPLTLTEIAHRLHRTPGSTKDYLSWLEDVDLIVVAAEALQLRRSADCACGCACTAGRRRRRSTKSRAKCRATRWRGCRDSEPPHAAPAPQASRRSPWPAGRHRG